MREVYILLAICFFLSLGMHYNEWLSHPLEHLSNLPSSGAYGLGALHPLIFTILIYILLWIPRFFIRLFTKNK